MRFRRSLDTLKGHPKFFVVKRPLGLGADAGGVRRLLGVHVAQTEDVAMNLNLDPFWRSSVGFDRLLDLMDESLRYQPENNYPPYNIVRIGENAYRISLAVAGFKPDQINVTVQQNTLVVTGREAQKSDHDYVHRGIAARDFERRFSLADFVEVKDASFEDGLLQIDLVRELPDAMKPKRIEIRSGKALQDNKTKTIEHTRAAS
jgi:molecular chaperone IbpA